MFHIRKPESTPGNVVSYCGEVDGESIIHVDCQPVPKMTRVGWYPKECSRVVVCTACRNALEAAAEAIELDEDIPF